MAVRELFLSASPLEAYVMVRDRVVGAVVVELAASRESLRDGIGVGFRIEESVVRPSGIEGYFVVDRADAEAGITRAFQPWRHGS